MVERSRERTRTRTRTYGPRAESGTSKLFMFIVPSLTTADSDHQSYTEDSCTLPQEIIDNPSCALSWRYPPLVQEYQTNCLPVIRGPYAAPYGQSPSNHPHEIATKYTLRPLILPPHVLSPRHYHPFLSAPTTPAVCCLRALPVLPLPASTQTLPHLRRTIKLP